VNTPKIGVDLAVDDAVKPVNLGVRGKDVRQGGRTLPCKNTELE
jgi:hypothetical protein